MVAVISPPGKSIMRTLNYNENKVREKVAECISASGFGKDHDQLTFTQKYNRLAHQASLNDNVKSHSIHISINFAPEDFPPVPAHATEAERLAVLEQDAEKLNAIADLYMRKIGFGDQPYLVYRHHDAGHPHIHIVTVKVRADGSRIETQNIGKKESFQASRDIEKQFGLTPATGKDLHDTYRLKPVDVAKVIYGRSPTKRAITGVLNFVLKNYKYTSLAELNAVLSIYNIRADRGNQDSAMYRKGGLYYRLLDPSGEKVGKPIKASDIYNQPTLKNLQQSFLKNSRNRLHDKRLLSNTLQLELMARPASFEQYCQSLLKIGVQVVARYAKTGQIFGLTYVDHRSKAVFNGSDLGRGFAAKAVLEHIAAVSPGISMSVAGPAENSLIKQGAAPFASAADDTAPPGPESSALENLIDLLFQPEYTNPYLPYPLRRKKKRKKKN